MNVWVALLTKINNPTSLEPEVNVDVVGISETEQGVEPMLRTIFGSDWPSWRRIVSAKIIHPSWSKGPGTNILTVVPRATCPNGPVVGIDDPATYQDLSWEDKMIRIRAIIGEESQPPDTSLWPAKTQAAILATWTMGQGLKQLLAPKHGDQPQMFRRNTLGSVVNTSGLGGGMGSAMVRTSNGDIVVPACLLPCDGHGLQVNHNLRILIEVTR